MDYFTSPLFILHHAHLHRHVIHFTVDCVVYQEEEEEDFKENRPSRHENHKIAGGKYQPSPKVVNSKYKSTSNGVQIQTIELEILLYSRNQ